MVQAGVFGLQLGFLRLDGTAVLLLGILITLYDHEIIQVLGAETVLIKQEKTQKL